MFHCNPLQPTTGLRFKGPEHDPYEQGRSRELMTRHPFVKQVIYQL